MKPYVICVGNFKGGSGKSITAVMLAWRLARRGEAVLLIDLDNRSQAHGWVQLAGLPGMTSLVSVELDYRKESLEEFVKDLGPLEYTAVVIDTPANDADVLAEALDVSDLVVIPVAVGRSDVGMLATTARIVRRAQRGRLLLARILLNRTGYALSKERWTREEVAKVEIELFRTGIPLRAAYMDAPGQVPPSEVHYDLLAAEIGALRATP